MSVNDSLQLLPEEFSDEARFKTDISTFDTGAEQRRSRWSSSRKLYSLGYPNAYDAQIDLLYDFYIARKGAYECFYLAVPPTLTSTQLVSGDSEITITGATKPAPTLIHVLLDSVEIFDWTYDAGTNVITFESAKTGSVEVQYYEMKLVRFLDDNMSREWFAYSVTRQGLDFITI